MATRDHAAAVGVFVVAALVLFGIGLFMIGNRQMTFTRSFTISTAFSRIPGLETGAPVRVSGASAGSVREIRPPATAAGKFRVTFDVAERLHPLVRTDSVASIQTEGLVGGTYLAVAAGSDQAPPVPPGATIPGREPFQLSDLLQQMSDTVSKLNMTIDVLHGDIERTVASIADTVEEVHELVDAVGVDVKTIASAGARITGDVVEMTDRVRNGQGTLGKLLNDDELYRRIMATARSAEDVAAQVRQAVADARRTLKRLQENNGPVATVTSDLRQTLDQANRAMGGLSENMEALKHNFLFRGFFKGRGYFSLSDISPVEYRQGVLTLDGERHAVRVWLKTSVLFEPSGPLRLTGDGKARLDSALATFLPYLPDSLLMVEGYAQGGTADERYLQARARAAEVREYLIGRFQLDPLATGIMPLGEQAAGSPDGAAWDGVALAVFVPSEAAETKSRR